MVFEIQFRLSQLFSRPRIAKHQEIRGTDRLHNNILMFIILIEKLYHKSSERYDLAAHAMPESILLKLNILFFSNSYLHEDLSEVVWHALVDVSFRWTCRAPQSVGA